MVWFRPSPHFDPQSSDLSSADLTAPRHLDFLAGLRDEAGVLTARDHAVLEALVSAAQARDETLDHPVYEVALDAVVRILRRGKRSTQPRDVLASTERLSEAVCTLPRLRKRRRMRLKDVLPDLDDDYIDDEEDDEDRLTPADLEEMAETLARVRIVHAETVRRYASARKAGLIDEVAEAENLEPNSWSVAYVRRLLDVAEGQVPDTIAEALLASPGHHEIANVGSPLMSFRPLQRYEIFVVDGRQIVRFAPASYLRHLLDVSRQNASGRSRFAYIDLGAMSSFSCRYTPAIYRHAIGAANASATPLDRVTGLTRTFTFDLDAFAQTIGYTWQRGGRAGQIRRNAVARIANDLELCPGEARLSAKIEGETVVVDIVYPPIADLRRVRTKILSRKIDDGFEVRRVRLSSAQMREYAYSGPRADRGRYNVKATTMLKVGHVIGGYEEYGPERWPAVVARAKAGELPELEAAIDRDGPDHAAFHYLVREFADRQEAGRERRQAIEAEYAAEQAAERRARRNARERRYRRVRRDAREKAEYEAEMDAEAAELGMTRSEYDAAIDAAWAEEREKERLVLLEQERDPQHRARENAEMRRRHAEDPGDLEAMIACILMDD